MIRSALILSAGILAAACFACVLPPPAPPPPPPPQAALPLATPTGTRALSTCAGLNVYLIDASASAPYSPDTLIPPKTVANGTIPPAAAADLQQAFSIAPDFFQQKLCSLTGIYIDPSPCLNADVGGSCSWGFRDPKTGNEYVGLSASLWANGSPAPILTDAATSEITFLLQSLNQGTVQWGTPPFTTPPYFDSYLDTQPGGDPANTSAMTVLATLAHEVGHIRWYEINVPSPGGSYNFTNNPLNPCMNDTKSFWAGSWNYGGNTILLEAPRWRNFGDVSNSNNIDHLKKPYLNEFTNPASGNALAQSLVNLHSKYQPWVSLLSSLTPDEDFVETYVFGVLTYDGTQGPDPKHRPYLQSLRLHTPGQANQDIVKDFFHNPPSRIELIRKVTCVMVLN